MLALLLSPSAVTLWSLSPRLAPVIALFKHMPDSSVISCPPLPPCSSIAAKTSQCQVCSAASSTDTLLWVPKQ